MVIGQVAGALVAMKGIDALGKKKRRKKKWKKKK